MLSISKMEKEYESEFKEIESWMTQAYDSHFKSYFTDQRTISKKLQDAEITDSELETVLIDVPLRLFDAAEAVSVFRIRCEAIKAHIKEAKMIIINNSDCKKSERSELIEIQTAGDVLLLAAYEKLLQRVESEMSYSRELIMSAKKIWTARKSTENSMPVAPVDSSEDIPDCEYVGKNTHRTYIG